MKYADFLEARSSGDHYVYFIAEIGKNFIDVKFEESEAVLLAKAIRLVEAAKRAGADAVKFQTHCVADEVLPIEFSSPHFSGMDRYQWVKRNEESTTLDNFWRPLKRVCETLEIEFFSTPMSKSAAIKLSQLGVDLWKVGSADVSDFVLLHYLASTGKPIILSTGMVSFPELERVISVYARLKVKPTILYCISKYPCPPKDFNMSTIQRLNRRYPGHIIGFSDHSVESCTPAMSAAALGASVIEKHFTLDRNAWGSDHKASLLPHEYEMMVKKVRRGVKDFDVPSDLLGYDDRELEGAENIYRKYFEKGLVLACPVSQGETFGVHHFSALRPLMHLKVPASDLFNVVGRKATRHIMGGEPLSYEMIQRS